MKYQLIIFDLDGTLADSFPWFLGIVNTIAEKYRFKPMLPEEIPTLRGLEARELVRRLDVATWKLPLIARHMRKLKLEKGNTVPLFPGTGEMLAGLKVRGLTLAVVSSDSEESVRRTLGEANAAHIAHYACGASLFGKAPKFRAVMRKARVAPAAALAIGDEMRDADAAAQAGIAFGAVAWGYAAVDALATKRPAFVFRTMDEIVAKLAPR